MLKAYALRTSFSLSDGYNARPRKRTYFSLYRDVRIRFLTVVRLPWGPLPAPFPPGYPRPTPTHG
jgi:hypothetical protein